MSFGLATTLSNSQKLTPQMQQAIKLLQLSSLELALEVQAKLDSNPLLERVEDDDDDYEHATDADESSSELQASLTLDMWNQNSVNSAVTSTPNNDDSGDYEDFSDWRKWSSGY